MPRVVQELPGAEVGGSEVGARNLSLCNAIAGLSRSVHRSVTALWPRVASPKAQQVAWAAPVSKDPGSQAAQGTGSQDPAQPKRKRTESTYSSGSNTAP